MIEVEYRLFLDKNTYNRLEKKFHKTFSFLGVQKQITYYLNDDIDTRIQISNKQSRLWQKLGNLHDISRKEIDILFSKEDGNKLLEIFENLGFSIKVAWYRERKSFKSDDITIELDNTIGYGMILEIEILCNENDIKISREKIENFLKKFHLVPSKKDLFDKAYARYQKNWKELTKNLDVFWIDR
jgi:predicted adenylyl cyclase CyaB